MIQLFAGLPPSPIEVPLKSHASIPSNKEALSVFAHNTIVDWLETNPPTGPGTGHDATVCAECRKDLGRVGVDYIALASGAWVHHGCHKPWRKRRWQEAITALTR